jgi:hypothetical protein
MLDEMCSIDRAALRIILTVSLALRGPLLQLLGPMLRQARLG